MSQAYQPESAFLSEEDYLRSELRSEVKREYLDGQVYAMAGAGYNHNCITASIARLFGNHLVGTPCATFIAAIKVKAGDAFFYPDVLVDCAKMGGDDYFSSSPVIIVEVLSKTTRKADTTSKLLRYLNLPSLQEYVLIEQDIVSIQVLRRRKHWQSEFFYLGDEVTLESIGLTLPVAAVYDRVDNPDSNEFRRQHLLTAKQT